MTLDKLLGKDEIVSIFKELGMSESEVESSWKKISEGFTINFLTFVYQEIPEEDRKVIDFGIDGSTKEGLERLLALVNTYLNEHLDRFDVVSLGKKAAGKVVETMEQSINKKLSEGGN